MIGWVLRALDRMSPLGRRAVAVIVPVMLLAALVATFTVALRATAPQGARRSSTPLAPPRPAPRSSTVAPATSPPMDRPTSAARGAALRFLRGYLAFSYGASRRVAIPDADPQLIRSLKAGRPRVPPAARERRPRVTSLQIVSQAPGAVQATATIGDGSGPQYALVAYLERRRGGWVATRLGDD